LNQESLTSLSSTVSNIKNGKLLDARSITPLHTNFIDYVYQYCDNDNSTNNSIWNYSNGTLYKYAVNGYSCFEPIELLAGVYSFLVYDLYSSQSYIEDSTGINKISTKFGFASSYTGDITISEYSILYLSSGRSHPYIILVNKNNLLNINASNSSNYLSKGVIYSKLNISDDNSIINSNYDTTIYDQAFIKNGELTCNNNFMNANTSIAKYTEVDMGSNIVKILCRAKFRTLSNNASITLISTALHASLNVQDIVKKSIHVGFNGVGCTVETILNGIRTTHASYSYSINLNQEYTFGWYIKDNTITIYLPNGNTETVTDEVFSQYNGKYFIFEHFSYQNTQTNNITDEFGQPVITGIYCTCTNGLPLRDNFKRPNGLPLCAPTGHIYEQFRNHSGDLNNDTVYDNAGGSVN